jgi:hypothetical protein
LAEAWSVVADRRPAVEAGTPVVQDILVEGDMAVGLQKLLLVEGDTRRDTAAGEVARNRAVEDRAAGSQNTVVAACLPFFCLKLQISRVFPIFYLRKFDSPSHLSNER